MQLSASSRLARRVLSRAAAPTAPAATHARRHIATVRHAVYAQQKQQSGDVTPAGAVPAAAAADGDHTPQPSTEFLNGISQLINASRTSTTKILWQMRAQERADMDSHLALRTAVRTPLTPIELRTGATDPVGPTQQPPQPKVKPTNQFKPILPLDSFWSVSLPFDTDLSLYDDYVRFDGGVRFERILEDLDAFAGNVAHLHVKKGVQKLAEEAAAEGKPAVTAPDMSIVTASVDGITMNPKFRFPMDQHIALQGCVTWVGSSSMEIWIEMRIVRDPVEWNQLSLREKMARSQPNEDVILNAFFLMVARDEKTSKAAFVPPLDVQRMNESDLARFQRGSAAASRRKAEAANSLTRIPPTADEIKLIHHYIMNPEAVSSLSSSAANINNVNQAPASTTNLEIAAMPEGLATPGAVIIRPKTVSMAETEMQSATMTQPQDRNTNGKIFGGYLMKNAYELARCNAYMFCGANSHPFFVAVDTIFFLKPVEIGSIISFRSKICYSAGHPDPAFQVRVETLVHDLIGGKVYPSNIFHFTFQSDRAPVRKVVPNTYKEAVDFLDSRRRREKLAEQHRVEDETRAAAAAAAEANATKPPAPSVREV